MHVRQGVASAEEADGEVVEVDEAEVDEAKVVEQAANKMMHLNREWKRFERKQLRSLEQQSYFMPITTL